MKLESKNVAARFHQILASIYGITVRSGDDLIEDISYEYHIWSLQNDGPFEDGERHPYDRFVIVQKDTSVQAEVMRRVMDGDPPKGKEGGKVKKKKTSANAKKIVNYDYATEYCIKYHAVVVSSSDTRQEVYIYDRKIERYRLNNGDIEQTITEALAHNGFTAARKIRPEINEIMSRIKTRHVIPREYGIPFNFMQHAIPFRNGVYDIDEKKLCPASPAYGFSYTLDADYIEDIDTSYVENYLRGLVAPEQYPVLLQIVGSILLGETYKRFYVLYNIDGNNGKTAFQKFVTYMVGESNVANLSIEALTTHRFMLAELYGKVANIAGDIPQRPIYDTSVLKQIVGDDRITAEKKGKDPFTFTNKSVNIFSANSPPPIYDPTDAFWSRVVMVKFPYTFPVDPKFNSVLFTEENKSALVKLAIDYIPTLLANGPIQVDVTETEQEYRKVSDSVYAFVDECLESYDEFVFQDPEVYDHLSMFRPDDGKPLTRILEIEFEVIHRSYRNFCTQRRMKALGKTKFEKALEGNPLIPITVKRKGPAGNQIAIVTGARLNASGMYMEYQHPANKEDAQTTLAPEMA